MPDFKAQLGRADHPVTAKGEQSKPFAATVDDAGPRAGILESILSQRLTPQEVTMAVAHIEIPTEVLESARLSVQEVKQELALTLYAQRRLSIGKARDLAGLSLWEFRQLLGTRRIPPHYDESDLSEDLATLSMLRQVGS